MSNQGTSLQKKFRSGLKFIGNAASDLSSKLHKGNKGPQSLQILNSKGPEKGFELINKNLAPIFYHPDVKDNPVMIVSVAGAMREGKSFLLNLLTYYLECEMDPTCFDAELEIPQYFKWAPGTSRTTVGIYVWSKPYVVTMDDGTKVAIILMDTQGAFDRDGTAVASGIFAFSTLISSVQLYNIKGYINQSHLEPLSLFTEYASKVRSLTDEDPFQKLMFVLRDWPVDSGYKIDDGELYLASMLYADEDADSGVKSVRRTLQKAFSVLECSLLPDPGDYVAGRKMLNRPLMFSDLDKNFKAQLKVFFSTFFSKPNLQLKQVNGINLTGFTIMNFIQKHYESLESGKVFTPMTALEANNIGVAQTLVYELVNSYEEEMNEILSALLLTDVELIRIHYEKVDAKLREYDEKVDETFGATYKENLISELESRLIKREQERNSKEKLHRLEYSQLIQSICNDFSKKEGNISDMAEDVAMMLQKFEQTSQNLPECFKEHYRNKLIEDLEMIAADKKKVQQALNRLEQDTKKHFIRYQDEMKDWLGDKYVTEEDLEKYHKTCEKHALELFESNIRQYAVDLSKVQSERSNLQLAIQQEFGRIKKNNQAVLEEIKNELQTHLEYMKTKYLDEMGKIPAGVYINPKNMKERHQSILKDVKEDQEKLPSGDIYQKFKEKEIKALDDLYTTECTKMEQRKPIYREESAWYKILLEPIKKVAEAIWQTIPDGAGKKAVEYVTEKIWEKIFNKPKTEDDSQKKESKEDVSEKL